MDPGTFNLQVWILHWIHTSTGTGSSTSRSSGKGCHGQGAGKRGQGVVKVETIRKVFLMNPEEMFPKNIHPKGGKFCYMRSLMEMSRVHVSNEKRPPSCFWYIGDYTTELYRGL